MKRKAVSAVGLAISIAILLATLYIAFTYMQSVSVQGSSLETAVQVQGEYIAGRVLDTASWTIYRIPVTVKASTSLANREMEVLLDLPEGTDPNSIAVLDESEQDVASQYDADVGEIVWQADLSAGKNRFYVVYAVGTSMTLLSYPTDISTTAAGMSSSEISASLTDGGMSSLVYDGYELLQAASVLGTSSSYNITSGPVRARASHSGWDARVYSSASKLKIVRNETSPVTLNLVDDFEWFYDGSSVTTFSDYSGAHTEAFSFTTNFLDLYDDFKGLAVIGANMTVTLTNYNETLGYKRVYIENASSFELFGHHGNYTAALAENESFHSPPLVTVGVPGKREGVSEEKFANMSASDIETLKALLGVEGADMFVSIEAA